LELGASWEKAKAGHSGVIVLYNSLQAQGKEASGWQELLQQGLRGAGQRTNLRIKREVIKNAGDDRQRTTKPRTAKRVGAKRGGVVKKGCATGKTAHKGKGRKKAVHYAQGKKRTCGRRDTRGKGKQKKKVGKVNPRKKKSETAQSVKFAHPISQKRERGRG